MRKAEIYLYNRFAGILIEDENGYSFEYDKEYLANTPQGLSVLRVSPKAGASATNHYIRVPVKLEQIHRKNLTLSKSNY